MIARLPRARRVPGLLCCLLAGISAADTRAMAQDGALIFAGSAWLGRDTVPPDIIDSTADQNRIYTDLGTEMELGYQTGPVIVRALAGTSIFLGEDDYNRYGIGAEAQYDLPLADDGHLLLRVVPGFDHVRDNDGWVYDRARIDTQLVWRHNPEHATTARLRYGYRNQNEDTLSGYDQSEWLAELRHAWRPGNGRTRISGSIMAMRSDADDERYSYDGWGVMLLGRTPLNGRTDVYGRIYVYENSYKDAFSARYDYNRRDRSVSVSGGAEYTQDARFSFYGEGGYIDTSSNIPTRAFAGVFGRIGLRWRFPVASPPDPIDTRRFVD